MHCVDWKRHHKSKTVHGFACFVCFRRVRTEIRESPEDTGVKKGGVEGRATPTRTRFPRTCLFALQRKDKSIVAWSPFPLSLLSPVPSSLPSFGSPLSPPPPPPHPFFCSPRVPFSLPFLPLLLPSPCPPQWNPPLLCRVRFVQANFLQFRAGAVTVRLTRFLSITT